MNTEVQRKPTRRDRLNEMLKEFSERQVLKSPNQFAEDMNVPNDLAVAFLSNRPELVKLAKPRALTEEECRKLYHILGVVLETNQMLREHAHQVSVLVKDWGTHFKGLARIGADIENFADFREAVPEEESEE